MYAARNGRAVFYLNRDVMDGIHIIAGIGLFVYAFPHTVSFLLAVP